ncbi:MAG: DUF2752 domain-containing protein [Sandaracinaceae bacterium]
MSAPPTATEADAPPERAPSRPFSLWRLLAGSTPILVLGLFFALDLPICPSRALLGIPCPGCGLTRATAACLTGDLHAMLHFHPLAPIITPLVLFSVGRAILVYAGAVPSSFDPLSRVPSRAWAVFAVVLIGVWIVRALGGLGGLPDPIDLTAGWLYRAGAFLISGGG